MQIVLHVRLDEGFAGDTVTVTADRGRDLIARGFARTA